MSTGLSMEKTVNKATSSKEEVPKRKHVRNIILQTHTDHGAYSFFTELMKRPLENNEIVCWKALLTTHSLLHEGHPSCLQDAYHRISFFQNIRDSWLPHKGNQVGKGYFDLNAEYSNFLIQKISFHNKHPQFKGSFSTEDIVEKRKLAEDPNALEIVNHMMDLQQSIYSVQRTLFGQKNVDDVKCYCLVLLVVESYNLYSWETHLITKLVDKVDNLDVLSFVIERFYSQYITLRSFYFEVSNIKNVTALVAVPNLPKDPPVFSLPKKTKEKAPKPERKEKREPEKKETQEVKTNPFAPTVHKESSWVTFPSLENPLPTPTVVVPPLPLNTMQQQQQQFYNQVSPRSLGPSPRSPHAEDFSDLVSLIKDRKPSSELERKKKEEEERKKREEEFKRKFEVERKRLEEEKKKKSEEDDRRKGEEEGRRRRDEEDRRRRDEEDRRRREEERKRREEEERRKREEEEKRRQAEDLKRKQEEEERKKREDERIREEQEKIKRIIQEETSKEIRELKLRIVELENALERERDKNKSLDLNVSQLQRRIEELQRNLQSEHSSVSSLSATLQEKEVEVEKVKEERERIRQEQQTLKTQLENVLKQQLEENLALICTPYRLSVAADRKVAVKEINVVNDAVEKCVARLDLPTNLGNEMATVQEILNEAELLSSESDRVAIACSNSSKEQLIESLNSVMSLTNQLFSDVKGVSRKIDDQEAQQQLLAAVKAVGGALSNLLLSVKNCGGTAQDEEDKKSLAKNSSEVKLRLTDLANAAKDSEKVPQPEVEGEDLEALAEKELLAAAKAIEEAAKTLLAAKEKPKVTTGSPEVADAILDAVLAITKATSMLVRAAAEAQAERVSKGRVSGSSLYRRDPTWSQGLISAARAVASSTSLLIETANKAVAGEIEEEAVIAASKAVTSSTAQLIAATKAKADDLNSPTQQNLNRAAAAVNKATSTLVAAAKAASNRSRQMINEEAASSDVGHKIKEMQVQTEILKLENQLEGAREKLFALRRNQYK